MNFSINKKELQEALVEHCKVVPIRSTLPILSCALFSLNKNGLKSMSFITSSGTSGLTKIEAMYYSCSLFFYAIYLIYFQSLYVLKYKLNYINNYDIQSNFKT